jgi:hypothetical protein
MASKDPSTCSKRSWPRCERGERDAIPRGGSTSTCTRSPRGAQIAGSVGPNSAMTGTPTAAAKCVIPESFPIRRRRRRAIEPVPEVFKTNPIRARSPLHALPRLIEQSFQITETAERPVLARASRERMKNDGSVPLANAGNRCAAQPDRCRRPASGRSRPHAFHKVRGQRGKEPNFPRTGRADPIPTVDCCRTRKRSRRRNTGIDQPRGGDVRNAEQIDPGRRQRPNRSAKRTRGPLPNEPTLPCSPREGAPSRETLRRVSPIAPGRTMRRRKLLNVERQRDVDGLGRQAHPVIAGLITELAGDHRHPVRRAGRDLELRSDVELTVQHRQWLFGELELLHLGFRICDLGHFWSGAALPGKPQRNQIGIRRSVAVGVIPGFNCARTTAVAVSPRFTRSFGGGATVRTFDVCANSTPPSKQNSDVENTTSHVLHNFCRIRRSCVSA